MQIISTRGLQQLPSEEVSFFQRKIGRLDGELRIENSLKIWYSGLCEGNFPFPHMAKVSAKEDEDKTMEQYKQEFIGFMIESRVLQFGDFTLKSGRKSPFL